jgi:hypothetical protein
VIGQLPDCVSLTWRFSIFSGNFEPLDANITGLNIESAYRDGWPAAPLVLIFTRSAYLGSITKTLSPAFAVSTAY